MIATGSSMIRKPRILFVDDELPLLEGLEMALRDQRRRWDMRFAQGADRGLELAFSEQFDAVILDVMMPGRSGFEVLQELRGKPATKDLPVVMLTGVSDSAIKRKALERGADDLLAKPIAREDLIARIESMLRIKGYQDRLKNQNAELDRKVRERTIELEDSRVDIIWRLAKAAEFRDDDTGNHVIRVAHYCSALAQTMGMPLDFVELVFLTSPLHDVGKIGVPDDVLLKKGKLNDEEWVVMRAHSRIGADILAVHLDTPLRGSNGSSNGGGSREIVSEPSNPLIETASRIAISHHEKWDGSGYPSGLRGASIPLEGRLVAVGDVFDALTSERPYKKAFSEERAIEIILEGRGSHFDPAVIAAFEDSLEQFSRIRGSWSDGSTPDSPTVEAAL